jgi:flagellin-like protein
MRQVSLFADDTGVSPVIGVVLMVAITVLLAATAASLFLGFQDRGTEATPSIAFEFDYNASGASDSMEVTHVSGEIIDAGELEVVVSGASPADANGRYTLESFPSMSGPDTEVSAGTTVLLDESAGSLDAAGDVDLSGATVSIVWTGGDGDRSTELESWSQA